MTETFQTRWNRAMLLEAEGEPLKAAVMYRDLLAEDGDRLHVHLRLSALEEAAGRYRSARHHALGAAGIVPRRGRWKDLAATTRRLLDFAEHGLASRLILEADWNDAGIIRQSAMLSQHLWLSQRVEDGLRLIDTVGPRAAESHVLSYSRALALRYLGRMEEATAEFERCIALQPHYAYAHWSLAHHQRAAAGASRTRRIRGAIAATDPEASAFPYLSYAMFKELDDAGQPEEAWPWLERGARAKRMTLAFSPEREQAAFARLRRSRPAVVESATASAASADLVPVFIVGMPRSGTTLLDRILGNHSRATSAGELGDFAHAMAMATNRFPDAYPGLPDADALDADDYSAVGAQYLARVRPLAGGARFLVDKNPMNFANAAYICAALPHARILCLRRSPLDACFSNLKELFSNDSYGYSYDQSEIAAHYHAFDALSAHWRATLGDRYLEVSYERLVADPLPEARRAMDFCGMTGEEPCVDITRNTAPVSTASSSQVREPIHRRGVDAWRRYEDQLQPLRTALAAAADGDRAPAVALQA